MRSTINSAASGQAALGTLYIQSILAEPRKIYYGPEDVHGNVLLRYKPRSRFPPTPGLFGPLHVDVRLTGTVRTTREDGSPVNTTHLFTEIVKVHDGAFRAEGPVEHTYPFTLTFPENATLTADGAATSVRAFQDEVTGRWQFRKRVDRVEPVSLPPTMESKIQNPRLTHALHHTVAAVQYTFSVQASMPGIDVDIVIENPQRNDTLLYDQPRVPASVATFESFGSSTGFTQPCSFEDESLRPSEDRPHGFLGKTKALLKHSEVPTYVFTATVSGLRQHAFIGQPLTFDVSIATHESSTAQVNPDVYLDSCTVSLLAHTTCTKPANIEILRKKEFKLGERHPFGKQYGWSRTIDMGVLSHVPTSFTFRDFGRSYKLRIQSQFSIGREKKYTSRDVPIIIHPPLFLDNDDHAVTSGPSQPSLARMNLDSSAVLPGYEEVITSNSTSGALDSANQASAGVGRVDDTALPGYEEAMTDAPSQPSYEEATSTDDATHDVSSSVQNGTDPSASPAPNPAP